MAFRADGASSSAGGTHAFRDCTPLEPKHKIFLSHSGAQKAFVKRLCIDLERSDRYPFFDIRRDSLPIGENFPNLIFQAIKQCHVGVVVLSEEFFMSKWPMLELATMVKAQKENCNMKIVPVFLGLSRNECRAEESIRRWMSKWCELAENDSRVDVEEWKATLKVFGPINDISSVDHGLDEVQCCEEIVEAICKWVPPNTMRDDSYVQGKLRLCGAICEKINELQESPLYGARVLGLYGVGGIGKTTACMALCNHYHVEFRGKVCHVKLENESELDTLQDVVRRLTDINSDLVKGFNEDECRDLLRKGVHRSKTFLAIDNVSDSWKTIEQASFYLRIGYSYGSIVIVTARSLHQFKGLKIDESNCMEMPELEESEAKSLFMYHANMNVNESNKTIIMRCVKRCRFGKGNGRRYHYHPLALQVLGVHVGYNSKEWMVDVEDMDAFNQLRDGKEHPIFSILRRSFDACQSEDQFLFMDAALFFPEQFTGCVFEWLSMMHQISVDDVKKRLFGLQKKSLIEDLGNGRSNISIHDLWREFAIIETTFGEDKYRRWMYEEYSAQVTPKQFGLCGRWKDLQRICLKNKDSQSPCVVKQLNLDNCSNITVLKLVELNMHDVKLNLSKLKQLKSLELDFGVIEEYAPLAIYGLKMLKNLVHLYWSSFGNQTSCIEEIGNLTNLQVLVLERWDWLGKMYKMLDLKKLIKLRILVLFGFTEDTTIHGLNSKMTDLQSLSLCRCRNLHRCNGVDNLIALVDLDLSECESLEELPNLQKLKNLQNLDIHASYTSISSIPGLEGLVSLQKLKATRCEELITLPGLNQLTNLQELKLGIFPIQNVPGLGNLTNLLSLGIGSLQRLED